MSDRDKKIILFLLILMVTILPYVFYIKNTKVETETTLTRVQELQVRYDQLKEMDEKREFYEEEIVRMHKERDVIVASFPADVRSENYAMFLLQTEYSSELVLNEETGKMELEYPIIFDTVTFGVNLETQISSDSVGIADAATDSAAPLDTEFVAISNLSAVTYNCYYDGMKYLLEYLMDYEDPMIYTSIDMTMDLDTGVVSGTMQLAQYAISGPDRTLDDVDFTIMLDDTEVDLSLEELKLRGNKEFGIFGPLNVTEVEEEAPAAEVEAPVE